MDLEAAQHPAADLLWRHAFSVSPFRPIGLAGWMPSKPWSLNPRLDLLAEG
jgi:hypothetical protein